jgi:hypothetical protein
MLRERRLRPARHARDDLRADAGADQSNHAAVLTTGPNTYDRFVRQFGNECDWPEVPISTTVPTKDGGCRVYRAKSRSTFPTDPCFLRRRGTIATFCGF